MTLPAVRIGTRGSALAMAQVSLVAGRVRELGFEVEVVTIRTQGDRARSEGSMMLERGAFVKDLETALLRGDVDLAVHSAKDLPVAIAGGTELAAFPPRGDARDALVSRGDVPLSGLPSGARVGTESPRRQAFVRMERPDLVVEPVRGNVDTRLSRLDAGERDALIVAAAGLVRLGLAGRIAETFASDRIVPAVGQGALAVQARLDDPWGAHARRIDDRPTRMAVMAERAFLAAMGGGCRAPFAAHARWSEGRLTIDAAALRPDGGAILRDRLTGSEEEAAALGERAAELLLARGAADLAAEGAA
jgi:hydroxymethylbilane synthase